MSNELAGQTMDTTMMAVDRTLMAADRSLMAWVRTGLSMISFGFTIYKFLEYSREQVLPNGKVAPGIATPELVGLFMVGMGIISLILGILENVYNVKRLIAHYQFRRPRYALFMAVILAFFGLFLLLSIMFKIKTIES